MQKYKEAIDKEIYPIIKKLNNLGYKTQYSCSGHGKKGYISFKRKLSIKHIPTIKQELKNYGVKNPKFYDTYSKHSDPYAVYNKKAIKKFKVIDI